MRKYFLVPALFALAGMAFGYWNYHRDFPTENPGDLVGPLGYAAAYMEIGMGLFGLLGGFLGCVVVFVVWAVSYKDEPPKSL